MRTYGVLRATLLAISIILVSTFSFGRSEAFKDNIYNPGHLKPIDSTLKVRVGEPAPDFTLPAITGERVSLNQFKGKKNVVLSFVPAAWTPVCSDQWPGYNIAKGLFEHHDTILLGVTVDNIPTLFAWTLRMTPDGSRLWFPVLSDFWPHGAVAVITPFNFPLEIMTLQTMGALYMGNKPVLKQATITSIVAEAFVRLLLYCGMPAQDLLLIHCGGQVMEKLVTNPVIQFTQFTGSTSVADRLLKLTKGKCRIEDAGFDWKVVGPNAIPSMLDFVATQCDMDAYAASGQKCSAQSLLAVHENWVKLGLLARTSELSAKRTIKDLSIGPVLTWTNDMIEEHINKLLRVKGAKILFGGKRLKTHSIPSCYGSFEPTAVFLPLKSIASHVDLATTEVFGPFQVVTTWETKDDLELLLDICNSMEHHLTAGVVDNDPDFLNEVLGQTINGTTYAGIRGRTTGAPQWHFFGPCGHPAAGAIGTVEAIRNVWSLNRTIIKDTNALS